MRSISPEVHKDWAPDGMSQRNMIAFTWLAAGRSCARLLRGWPLSPHPDSALRPESHGMADGADAGRRRL
jgi:hypothetical protein